MEKKYYDERPAPFETIRSAGMMSTIIRMEVKESEDPEQGAWECEEVEYCHREALSQVDYGHMVAALVRSHFSADDVEAILNNYVASKTTEHKTEWNALQAWRTKSKEAAAAVLEGLPEEPAEAREMSEIEPLEMEDL